MESIPFRSSLDALPDPLVVEDSEDDSTRSDSLKKFQEKWIKEDQQHRTSETELGISRSKEKHKSNATEVLSEHSERFRMRLIRHFRLLENLNEIELILETPKYHASDIADKHTRKELMEDNPYALVKFSSIPKRTGVITKQERRWKRIQCRETTYPPMDLWANWVVESDLFQNSMLLLIVINAVLLVVDAEIGETVTDQVVQDIVRVIRTLDYCCLWVFVLEIFLKWIDDFKTFWKNGWNELDFYITIISILPEIILWFTNENQLSTGSTLVASLSFLRVLRITRLLKMVSRFEQARIILMSVSKAFSAMSFILLLLALFMWIFALMGQVIFVRYTNFDGRSEGIFLLYQNAFSGTLWSFATLFQLMTLDHWLETLTDIMKVMRNGYESTVTVFYILSWIWVGSFVFKNIFAGIMVNNFQTIRNDLHWEKKEKEAKNEVDKFKKEFTDGILKGERPSSEIIAERSSKHGIMSESSVSMQKEAEGGLRGVSTMSKVKSQAGRTQSTLSVLSQISAASDAKEEIVNVTLKKVQWDNIVQRHMDLHHQLPGEVVWSRDLLFKYLQAMEMLQENMQERKTILHLLNLALLQIHDR